MRHALPRRAHALAPLVMLGALACLAAALPGRATAGGLNVNPDTAFGPRWSARLSITSTPVPGMLADGVALRPKSARLLGDYFLSPAGSPADGGLRLTSGVFLGPQGALFGPSAGLASRPGHLTLGHQQLGLASPDATPDSVLAWPYLGLGYSSGGVRTGWGFNADVGLAARNAGALRLGRMLSPNLDDMLRDMRLSPVLQLGVSYAF